MDCEIIDNKVWPSSEIASHSGTTYTIRNDDSSIANRNNFKPGDSVSIIFEIPSVDAFPTNFVLVGNGAASLNSEVNLENSLVWKWNRVLEVGLQDIYPAEEVN